MPAQGMRIEIWDAEKLERSVDALSDLLIDCVENGAAIGFLSPLRKSEAGLFWTRSVVPEIAADNRRLLIARTGNWICGTVQLVTKLPPNQPHRSEIAKMAVHSRARRKGIGRSLLRAAIDQARKAGKSLITLDTRTDDLAQPLYASEGFQTAGIIPDFALDPDKAALHSTTYMYKRL